MNDAPLDFSLREGSGIPLERNPVSPSTFVIKGFRKFM